MNIIEVFKPLLHHINREFLLDRDIEDIKRKTKIDYEALKKVTLMLNTNERIIKHKVGLLNLVEEMGNVSKACQVCPFSPVSARVCVAI